MINQKALDMYYAKQYNIIQIPQDIVCVVFLVYHLLWCELIFGYKLTHNLHHCLLYHIYDRKTSAGQFFAIF